MSTSGSISRGVQVVIEDSPTINLSGNGSVGTPLRADSLFPPQLKLASTSYDRLEIDEAHMVFTSDETFKFVSADCRGSVQPALTTVLDVVVGVAIIGTVTITDGTFVFALDQNFVVAPDAVVKLVSTQNIVFDYLTITMSGNIVI